MRGWRFALGVERRTELNAQERRCQLGLEQILRASAIGDKDCSGRSWAFKKRQGKKRKGKEEEERGGKKKGGGREII